MNEIELLQSVEKLVGAALQRLDEIELPAPDPALPAVLLLPGFMGVHLADATVGRVWLDPAAARRGDLSLRTALDATGEADAYPGEHLVPDGLVRVIYADLVHGLRRKGHAVHTFPFDFRRSLLTSVLLLRDLVTGILAATPGRKIILVGHSMGAMLGCLLPYYLPAFADRVEQSIFLGGPLGGTFDSVEAVTGTHWVLPRLVSLSCRETSRDFQASLATWPGVFGMLPDPAAFPGSACERVYDASRWPVGLAPRQAVLDQALAMKAAIRESPLLQLGRPVTQLLATRYPTVGALAEDGAGAIAAGPRTHQGDGTVAAASALPAGVIGYRTAYPHTLAPAEPEAIAAILALIHTGACALDPIRASDVTAAITPGRSPAADMGIGLIESGVTSLKEGCLVFPAAAWLLASS